MPTIQHALLRAVHRYFELEDGEILAEPLPNDAERGAFLLYEATEGGAGVLNRLAPNSAHGENSGLADLRAVARSALQLMHVNDTTEPECVAGCYRCILSYFNQPDHHRLDRRDPAALSYFERMAQAQSIEERDSSVQGVLYDLAKALPPAVQVWREHARRHKVPEPDGKPLALAGQSLPLVWHMHRVVALLEANAALERALESRGYAVVQFGPTESEHWNRGFDALLGVLGRDA